jgi:hypothetical protein
VHSNDQSAAQTRLGTNIYFLYKTIFSPIVGPTTGLLVAETLAAAIFVSRRVLWHPVRCVQLLCHLCSGGNWARVPGKHNLVT